MSLDNRTHDELLENLIEQANRYGIENIVLNALAQGVQITFFAPGESGNEYITDKITLAGADGEILVSNFIHEYAHHLYRQELLPAYHLAYELRDVNYLFKVIATDEMNASYAEYLSFPNKNPAYVSHWMVKEAIESTTALLKELGFSDPAASSDFRAAVVARLVEMVENSPERAQRFWVRAEEEAANWPNNNSDGDEDDDDSDDFDVGDYDNHDDDDGSGGSGGAGGWGGYGYAMVDISLLTDQQLVEEQAIDQHLTLKHASGIDVSTDQLNIKLIGIIPGDDIVYS